MQRLLVGASRTAASTDDSVGDAPDADAKSQGSDAVPDVPLTTVSLYQQYAKTVARWARALLGPDADIEDLVHDVFMVVHRKLPEFRGDSKVTTWLYEITIRTVKHRRRINRFQRFVVQWLKDASLGDGGARIALENLADGAMTPAGIAEQRQSQRILYQLLDGIDEKHRTALILFDLMGLPGQEIAEITNTSVGNVWVRINRGREQLLKRLQAFERKGGLK